MTFIVGLTNEVDSFNPFLGIEAPSFEMWALTYDYLIGYSMKDMSPAARAGHRVGDLRRRPHLDLHDARRREVVRRRAADRRRRRLHLRPHPRRRSRRRRPGRRTSTGVESVEAPDDTTVVLTLKKPNAVLPLLPIPIVPEHIWKDVSEKDVKSYANEPDGRRAGGRLRSVPAGRGHGRRLDLPLRGQPRLLEGRAARRRGRLPGLQERGPRGAGADQGRDRLRRGHLGAAGEVARGQGGHHRPQRRLAGLRRDRLQHRLGRPRDRRADGRPQPGRARPEVPVRAQLRHRPRAAASGRSTRAAASPAPRSSRRPTPTTGWSSDDPDAFAFDLDKAGQLLDEAGYTVGADGKRTMPERRPHRHAAAGRAQRLARRRSDVMEFFQEWLGRARHRRRGRDLRVEQADQTSSSTATSTPSSGAGTSSPTPTRCSAT